MKITRQTVDAASLLITIIGCGITYVNKNIGVAIVVTSLICKYAYRYMPAKK